MVAGLVGTVVGAWWWSRQRAARARSAASARGTVIFHNTPTPTPLSEEPV